MVKLIYDTKFSRRERVNYHFHEFAISGNDGYVAFQVEGNPVPTVEWFKVGLSSNSVNLYNRQVKIL